MTTYLKENQWSQSQYAKYRGIFQSTVSMQIKRKKKLKGVISVQEIAGKNILIVDLAEMEKIKGKGDLRNKKAI